VTERTLAAAIFAIDKEALADHVELVGVEKPPSLVGRNFCLAILRVFAKAGNITGVCPGISI
jgi:hypothetical protein